MSTRRFHCLGAAFAALLLVSCSKSSTPSTPQPVSGDGGTANAYILPGAVDLGPNAFGDKPVFIKVGERLRWVNADGVAHDVVADSPALPEFKTTGVLAPGADASFVMRTAGSTGIHCSIHPQMVGTLTVQ